jgi:hypothetical protein
MDSTFSALQGCYRELVAAQRHFDDVTAKKAQATRTVESAIKIRPHGANPDDIDDFSELASIIETYNQCSIKLEAVTLKLLRLRCQVGSK